MYQRLFMLQEEAFKALASSKRLEILQLLDGRELSVTQMTQMLALPQANLSQHLGQLRQAGLVATRRDAQAMYYRLSDSRVSQACSLIKDMLRDGTALTPDEKSRLESSESLYPIARDVVCGMRVSVPSASAEVKYAGQHYYFCASGCMENFEKNPTKYLQKEGK